MRKLLLDKLINGQKGISPKVGGFYLEALVYCLVSHGHKPGVTLSISGDIEENFLLFWTDEVTEQIKNSWNDNIEAAEYGATGLALILVNELLGFEILLRTKQVERIDYKIGEAQSLEIKAGLEVSGIWSETVSNTVNIRMNFKKKQVSKRLGNLPIFVIVVEFSSPKSKIKKYD